MLINENFISPHLISYITSDSEMYEIKFSMTFARDCRMKTVLEYTTQINSVANSCVQYHVYQDLQISPLQKSTMALRKCISLLLT